MKLKSNKRFFRGNVQMYAKNSEISLKTFIIYESSWKHKHLCLQGISAWCTSPGALGPAAESSAESHPSQMFRPLIPEHLQVVGHNRDISIYHPCSWPYDPLCHLGSFLLNQIQRLPCSASSASTLSAFLCLHPVISRVFRKYCRDKSIFFLFL